MGRTAPSGAVGWEPDRNKCHPNRNSPRGKGAGFGAGSERGKWAGQGIVASAGQRFDQRREGKEVDKLRLWKGASVLGTKSLRRLGSL